MARVVLTLAAGLLLAARALADEAPPMLAPGAFFGEEAGVDVHLVLRADGLYLWREAAVDRETVHDLGRWTIDAEKRQLVLAGAEPERYRISPKGTLRAVRSSGSPTGGSFELAPTVLEDDLDEPMTLTGTFVYQADAGLMMPCSVARWIPVAHEGANAELESAYLEARAAPGAPVTVSFEGHLTRRPRMEGDGEETVIVVTRFDGVLPGEPCGEPANRSLESTYWKLVEVHHLLALPPANREEAHLKLRGGEVQAFGGCNRISGSYERQGLRLAFGPLAATRMHCEERAEIERLFQRALAAHDRFRISGETLELFEGDELIARFTASE